MGPNMAGCDLDYEMVTIASIETEQVRARTVGETHGGAGCVIDGEIQENEDIEGDCNVTFNNNGGDAWPLLDHMEGEEAAEFAANIPHFDVPLKEPKNWGHEVPDDALEFPVIISYGAKQAAFRRDKAWSDYDLEQSRERRGYSTLRNRK